MNKIKLVSFVIILSFMYLPLFAPPPPGGVSAGGGAPIHGGASLFLGAVALCAFRKLKPKGE